MLKKRICAVLPVKDGIVVQSFFFKRYLPIGSPAIAAEFLSSWGIDEIVLIDISASRNYRDPDLEMIMAVSARSSVPLTVGGGIDQSSQVEKLMDSGADKILVNKIVLGEQANLVTEISKRFGSQCVVASIDAAMTNTGYRVYDYINSVTTEQNPLALARFAQDLGAGEILINSVDRDGAGQGFDVNLVGEIADVMTTPVIACGGASKAAHFVELFKNTQAAAAAAGNMFNFAEHRVTTLKALIRKHLAIRHDSRFDYADSHFDDNDRLLKQSDEDLANLLFVRYERDVI